MIGNFWGRALIFSCAVFFASAAAAGPGGQVTDNTPGYWRASDQRWFYIVDNVSIGMGDGGQVSNFRFVIDPGNTTFPSSELVPLTGDWDGDDITEAGYYHPPSNRFWLGSSNTAGGGGFTTFTFSVGISGVVPVVGNWDGTGGDEVGLVDLNTGFWYLAGSNTTGGGALSTIRLQVGVALNTLTPMSGNWDGIGGDTIGYYDTVNGRWFQINQLVVGAAVDVFSFRVRDTMGTLITPASLVPLAADWSGNGTDTTGYWDPVELRWYQGTANAAAGAGGVMILTVDLLIPGAQLDAATGDWDGPSS